jgi:REP element-mobilizing transposase RayT
MTQAPYSLDTPHHRKIVADAIVEVSQHRRWGLIALHVRTTHLHAIVETNADPKKVINDWKAYATRALRAGGFAAMNTSVWAARGNSTPLRDGVEDAIRYVLDGQGDAMESRYVGLGR